MSAIWAAARRLLVTVTREELAQILKDQEEAREASRLQLHSENLDNFRDMRSRLEKVEQSQARTEGMLSGRYPRVDHR